jgi:hypothetical protein
MPNIYDGYFGAERFGTGVFGVSSSGVPAIVNAMPANALSTLTQTAKVPQEVSLAVIIDGVDVTSNTTYYRVNNLEALPGGALLRMAGISAPTVGSTVAIDYMLTVDGGEYIGRIFSGIVGSVTTTQEPRGMPIHAVICRESATFSVLQLPPMTVQYTGTAHDLARIELSALGYTGVFDFSDFDIYAGDPAEPNASEFSPFYPSMSFATVELLLRWMAAQTSYGIISADPSGIVRVFAIDSTRSADCVYGSGGQTVANAGTANTQLAAPVSYGGRPTITRAYIGWQAAVRPMPIIGEDDYDSKLTDHRAVSATAAAFAASARYATYHDVTVSCNPQIVPGHKVTFVDEAAATKTGIVTGLSHEGQWPAGFTTTLNLAVMP